jgi:wobble nucleotide-excising tRNase
MILRIKSIKQVGRFKNFSGGGAIALGNIDDNKKICAILGDNTYGKSTIADIFRSANDDDNTPIIRRKTIPPDSGVSQSVELTYQKVSTDAEENIKYNSGSWTNDKLKNKVMIFDQEFIHKNIFTGINLTRDNKENFTDFILGEEGTTLGAEIEERNIAAQKFPVELRSTRPEYVRNEYDEKKVATFIKLVVTDSKATLEKTIADQGKLLGRLEKVSDFTNLPIATYLDGKYETQFEEITNLINKIGTASYDEVSKEALAQIQEQLKHIESHWLERGTKIISGNRCPYCTQDITPVKSLVDAYLAVFDEKYDEYVGGVNGNIQTLKNSLGELSATKISGSLSKNVDIIKKYLPFIGELEELANNLDAQLEQLQNSELLIRDYIAEGFQAKIDEFSSEKQANIHRKSVKVITPDDVGNQVKDADEKIETIGKTIKSCLELINKKRLETEKWTPEVVAQQKAAAKNAVSLAEMKLRRLEQDARCKLYLEKQVEQKDYKTQTTKLQKQLESSQSEYLKTLFASINTWFKKLGSSDFELSQTSSNRGHKKVYELKIAFCGEPIENDDLSKVFSESDRRNLALAIYLARAEQLDKENSILILDDPVVSYDDNRIIITCSELNRISNDFEQVIILTHYKTVIRQLLKCKANAIYIKIEKDSADAKLTNFDTNDFQLSDHEKAYLGLAAFANGDSNDFGKLRQFMERHIDLIFQPKLKELELTHAKLSEQIIGLKDSGDLSSNAATKLDGYRTSLNSDYHDDPDDTTIENYRTFTKLVLEELYKL